MGIQPLLLPIAIATLIFHVQSSESLRPASKEKKPKTEFFLSSSPSSIAFCCLLLSSESSYFAFIFQNSLFLLVV
jgi:hypothetical protein